MAKIFSNHEIEVLHGKYVLKNKAYFNPITKKEIESLKFEYMVDAQKFTFSPEGHDFPRIKCLLDFRSWIADHQIGQIGHLLSTDVSDPEISFLKYQKLTAIPYDPATGENDLHTISLEKEAYDFVLFSQTIEHLYNPFIALANLYEATKPGGYIFTSMPTINIPHMTPIHFTGYTPMGLCLLFESAGFNTVEIGYWGNFKYISSIFKTHLWPDYRKLLNMFGGVPNEERNVAQTWILARKGS